MRINLVTPFAEKDDAKKLGAKWDSQRKCWYIVDVADLTPFMRWMPDVTAASAESALDSDALTIATKKVAAATTNLTAVPTQAKKAVPHCGCDVKPWDDCEHTLAPT
jgi:hypothetical protein